MRWWRSSSLGILAAVAAASACSLLTDLSPLGDGGSDATAPVEAAADGFVLTVAPSHVTLDPKLSTDVTIGIVRGATFSDIVDVTVNGVGGLSGIHTSPNTLTFTGSAPVVLHIDIDATAPTPQDGALQLLGVGRSTQKSSSAPPLGVRIGSVLLDTQTSTTVIVPAYANRVGIKAWGAGGGPGSSNYDSYQTALGVGGSGGGGGMAFGIFDVAPGASLVVTVGGPGLSLGRWGGGGGGYSEVTLDAKPLVVAGGGGGGAEGNGENTDVYCTANAGGNGFAGGGANAEPGNRSATTSAGGAAGTGATAGIAWQGGDGAPVPNGCKFGCADGGAPGGGHGGGVVASCSGSAGGGGGGGFFGGGGGGRLSGTGDNGGGGGSGFVSDAGADVLQAHGAGASPAAATDVDYKPGTATGGLGTTTTNAAVPATPGRVIVRLPVP